MRVGERIRFYRKERGLTQTELADHADVSVFTLRQYESGARLAPRIEQLTKLANALGISVDCLLSDIDTEKLAASADQLRQQNSNNKRPILSQEEVDRQIFEAEQEHTAYLEKLCFDQTVPDEDYPSRIRYVTSFIEKNSDTLKLAMPGTHMAPDDIEEAKKIRASGGTPDSSE